MEKEDSEVSSRHDHISSDMEDFLKSQARKSVIKAIVDAGREVNIPEAELKLEEDLEAEIQQVVKVAHEVGLSNYSREDAVKALLQEEEHNKS